MKKHRLLHTLQHKLMNFLYRRGDENAENKSFARRGHRDYMGVGKWLVFSEISGLNPFGSDYNIHLAQTSNEISHGVRHIEPTLHSFGQLNRDGVV